MPVCHRPEFLALSLEKLDLSASTPGDIRIYLDDVSDERFLEVEWVRNTYLPRAEIFRSEHHVACPSGTWNILNAIKQGWETGSNIVYLIEEDVLIKPEYFIWASEQMATGKYLAACGRKDRNHFPLYGSLYTNPASALSRSLLNELIPHINDDYFVRLRAYLDEKFGLWDTQSYLDDGLIRRVIRQMGGQAVYPETPVCAHQGWRFYNKLDIYMNYETTIEKRIARLRELISKIRPGDRYAKDFEPF